MNAIELIQRIVTAKQGDAIGSQIVDVAEGRLEDANSNALAYIKAELEALQRVDWSDVAEAVDDLVDTLSEAGVDARYW